MTLPSRRSLITGLAAFIAAPAIVRAASLMPVKSCEHGLSDLFAGTRDAINKRLYGDMRLAARTHSGVWFYRSGVWVYRSGGVIRYDGEIFLWSVE